MRAGGGTRASTLHATGTWVVGALCATLAAVLSAVPLAQARWSAPAPVGGCSAALPAAAPRGSASMTAAPLIVFPAAEPQSRSGPGALLWTAPRGCAAGSAAAATLGAGSAEAYGATLSADDLPGVGLPLAGGAGGLTAIAAAGTAAGQVVVAGSAAGEGSGGGAEAAAGSGADEGADSGSGRSADLGALAEGRTVGAFTTQSLGGPATPVAAASSYLGDTALVSPVRNPGAGWAIAVRVQRHYSSAFARPRLLPTGPAAVSAVAVAMDYRADILLAWASGGSVDAREIPATGRIGPVRRLGGAGVEPQIGALLSDDGHAIVAWSSQSTAPGSGARPPDTTVALSICDESAGAARDSCGARTVERFRDPPRFPPPPGSPRLIRLSSEAVMLAWTGSSAGRYVVRASPVSLRRGAWAPVTISGGGPTIPPGQDAVLADLVPGPDAEALALWTTAPRSPNGAPNPRRRAILAAQGHYAGAGEVAFAAPEVLAPTGPNGAPAAAFDEQSGQALGAWARGNRITYALRAAGSAATPAPARTRATAGSSLRAPLLVLAILVLLAAAALLRRAAHRPGRMRARRG